MYTVFQSNDYLDISLDIKTCFRVTCFNFKTHTCNSSPHNHLAIFFYKEGNVLFNDTLNTFYLRLYGVRHMVKDHSDSEKGNPLPPHRLLFPINSKGYFICTIPQTR